MPGRHAAVPARRAERRRSLPVRVKGPAAGAVALALVALVGWTVVGARSTCDVTLTVAAAPEIAATISTVASALEKDGFEAADRCVDLEVAWAEPADVLAALHDGEQPPDLWIPDTSAWLSRLPAQLRSRPSASVAKTPVVLAGPSGAGQPATWLDALSAAGAELLDPRSSGASVGALAALHAEAVHGVTTGTALSRWLVARAQVAPAYSLDDADLLQNAGNGGDAAPRWFPTTEQRFIQHDLEFPESGIAAAVPRSGTVLLDYPLVPVAGGDVAPVAREAAQALTRRLQSPAGTRRLASAGYRPASGVPTEARNGMGVVTEIGVVHPAGVAELLGDWLTLSADARMLVVLDVSGSMGEYAGAGSRIALARDAALGTLRRLPDDWEVGLWVFSLGLGEGDADHAQLAPVRGLAEASNGTTHRTELSRAMQRLPSLVGGGTALYDTTLAAYRAARDGYRPGMFNSVVVLTDGRNEDPDGVDLQRLLDALRSRHGDDRPVPVFTIGMGPKADTAALRQIAEAGGAESYVARDPRDLGEIFGDVLLERAGWGLQ